MVERKQKYRELKNCGGLWVLVGIVRIISWTSKGRTGSWKLTEVEEQIFGEHCRDGCMHKFWEWRSTYHFLENSTYLVLKIELMLTVLSLSSFERKSALKDPAFWWVACLIHKVLTSVYSLIINLIGLAWHMVWYI